MLWYANVNTIFVQLIHYLRIFPFFMYSWKCITLESIIFITIIYFKPEIETPYIILNDFSNIMAPEIIIIILILLFRFCFPKVYQNIEIKYSTEFNNLNSNKKYSYGKYPDMFWGFLFPSITVIILILHTYL